MNEDEQNRKRRWGSGRALFDDGEAATLLLEAAARCIAKAGSVRISMVDVAEEAGVTRSTLYRYFPTRTDLVTALLLARAVGFVSASVAAMPDPGDAAASLTRLILHPIEAVRGSPITEALFSPESQGFAMATEIESHVIFDIAMHHYGPPLARWKDDGQLRADIDIATTVRWIIALAVLLLTAPWRDLSDAERTDFVDKYVARALLAEPT